MTKSDDRVEREHCYYREMNGIIVCHYHSLRSIGSTVITMNSKVNGKMEILAPIDLKLPKILKPKLDRKITSLAPLTRPIFVEIGPRGSASHVAEI